MLYFTLFVEYNICKQMKEVNKMSKSAQLKIKLLTSSYSTYAKKYVEWKDKYNDDRRLYQNIFEELIKALKEMEKIENNLIWVAFNDKFHKELDVMDKIITRFEGKTPIESNECRGNY